MKLPGKDSKIYGYIRDNIKPLLAGTILVVDPSCGSASSMPGWSIYKQSVLTGSGILTINPSLPIHEKLRELHRLLRNMSIEVRPDLCLYEQIPVSAHGGRSQVSHATLLMAVGVTMCAIDADHFVGLMPVVWKCRVRDGYVKSDERDAIEMGWIAIEMAKEILRTDPPRKYRT